uniref:Uncharacterized protein n=1 Tax=Amphiprion ocellaris TaxID=80972 RepID=A0A3Q1AJC4_AMPOC
VVILLLNTWGLLSCFILKSLQLSCPCSPSLTLSLSVCRWGLCDVRVVRMPAAFLIDHLTRPLVPGYSLCQAGTHGVCQPIYTSPQ